MKTKTQFTNRMLSLVLSIMMVVSMLPASALSVFAAEGDKVSVTIGGETTYYTSIKDAVAKANESGNATITLLQDTTTGERLDITNSATLDLNGNSVPVEHISSAKHQYLHTHYECLVHQKFSSILSFKFV